MDFLFVKVLVVTSSPISFKLSPVDIGQSARYQFLTNCLNTRLEMKR